MIKTVHGVVRGKTIGLAEDLGVTEGRELEVQVTVVRRPEKWGEGIRRCAGAMAPYRTEEDGRILEEIQRDHKRPNVRDS